MRYTKQAYVNCEPLVRTKALSQECNGDYSRDGKQQECGYRADAYRRVRRNNTQFIIGCNNENNKTEFMKHKFVRNCESEADCDTCDTCYNYKKGDTVQCRARCVSKTHSEIATRQRINKTVMLSSSEYLMNKAALTVSTPAIDNVKLNSQASDRIEAAENKTNVRTRNYSSTRRTRLSLKPGALAPGGRGVDVKHNSYERYLAKKKGKNSLRGRAEKPGVIAGCECNEEI